MLNLELNNRRGKLKLEPFLRRIEKAVAKHFKKPAAISLAIVNEKDSERLNRSYRGKKGAADVLTFVYGKEDAPGEIVLCYEKLKERAQKEKKTLTEEAVCLIVHGICHILGYTHKNNKAAAKMEKEENTLLKNIRYGY